MRFFRAMRWLAAIFPVMLCGCDVLSGLTFEALPQHAGVVVVGSIEQPVEVYRNAHGVPHIYAKNLRDLAFAQGYVHAQDRWFQMDLYRHVGRGALGELFGKREDLIRSDVYVRSLKMYETAQREAELLSPEPRLMLQAFTNGINAYIKGRTNAQLAAEYPGLTVQNLNVKIAPWTLADSLVWGKVIAWELTDPGVSFFDDVLEAYDQEIAEAWQPSYPHGVNPTILMPKDLPGLLSEWDGLKTSPPNPAGPLNSSRLFDEDLEPAFLRRLLPKGPGVGSNSWVIGGNRTKSGKPILANDTHLGSQMPSLFYEVGLHFPGAKDERPVEVVGLAFAPLPGVIIGHNGRIAWGVTASGVDTWDNYNVTVNPANPLQYWWDGAWRDMTVRQEVFHFNDGSPDEIITIRDTHHGPIVNENWNDADLALSTYNNDDPFAVQWTGMMPGTLVEAFLGVFRAQGWDEFREALRDWDAPQINVSYADVDGNIGFQLPGRVPLRSAENSGLSILPGDSSNYDWQGFLPYEYLPHVLNPGRGYIISANQVSVPPEYFNALQDMLGPAFNANFHSRDSYGLRAKRIRDLILARDDHTVDTSRQMQMDDYSEMFCRLADHLGNVVFDDPADAEKAAWLASWSCRFEIESPQAILMIVFWRDLLDAIYSDQLDPPGGSQAQWAVQTLLDEPNHKIWDDVTTEDVVENRDAILARAFRSAWAKVETELGAVRGAWRWGNVHTITFVNRPLGESGVPFVEDYVNRGPYPAPGGPGVLNVALYDTGDDKAATDLAVTWIPVIRIIFDLADWDNTRVVNSTGQSSHPLSPNYGDQIQAWLDGDNHALRWSRDKIVAESANTLILLP